jgi:hypothetical protein
MTPRSGIVVENYVAGSTPADFPGQGFAEQACVLLALGIRYEKPWDVT